MKFSELLEAEGIKQREAPTAEDATSLFMSLLIQSQMEAISLEQDTEGLKEGKFSQIKVKKPNPAMMRANLSE